MKNDDIKQTSKLKLKHLSLCLLAALASPQGYAEEAKANKEIKEKEIERISILGSNIKRASDIGALPVTTLTESDIENTGAMTGDDLLRSIPQMGEINFGAATGSGGVNDARGDVSSINLRGLGTGNTLSLLNGRRIVTHPGTQSENFVPVSTVNSNTLPISGLRSLQVLRDGAAAIYGSDAVAGVVNYQLKDDYDGQRISLSHGGSSGTTLRESTLSYLGGTGFNDGKSHFTGSATYYDRNGMSTADREYSKSHDLREYPTLPEGFIGDTQLDNRSTLTPWGEFRSDSLKTFHIQPDSMSGCVEDLGDGLCADKGSLGRELRTDRAAYRSFVSDVNRLNLYGYLTHEFSNNLELFSELTYYSATAERTREQTGNLTAQRFMISADAAYNPFGEEVQVRKYRAIDSGPRMVEVDDTSYRMLAGLRGDFGDWAWESAAFYTAAETNDNANRIQASKFQAAINNTDPAMAYNPFNGADANNPNVGDPTANPQSVIDQFMVNVSRDSMTSLASVDFKVNNGALFSLPAGEVGIAMGVEFRHETFEDNRDPLLDGSSPFVDAITGEELSGSDVLGSSPTPDSKGDRNVTSAYAELLVPLLDIGSQYIEMQLAARYENFSDVGDALKPKVALYWEPADWLSLRASYAGGFRAPGLPQVTAEGVPRSNLLYDPVLDDSYSVIDIRSGSTDLKPEESENISYGFIFKPTSNLSFTMDYWKIEQEDIVGILPGSSQLLYDSLLRSQGSQNDAVIRNEDLEVVQINNDYMNLNVREIEGVDFSLLYEVESRFGDWDFSVNAAHLLTFEQLPDPISAQLIAAQEAGDPSVPADRNITNAGDLMMENGRPEWRARAEINWRMDQIGAGVSYNYISEVTDTSATYTDENDEVITLPVASYDTINLYADYRFQGDHLLDKSKLRLGVRNITDEQAPMADESSNGYFGKLHSNRGRYVYMNFSKSF